MMDDLMDLLDQESTNSTLNSALNSGANSFSAHLQATPPATVFEAPRRMTGENMPLPVPQMEMQEVHTYQNHRGQSFHGSGGASPFAQMSASPATSLPASLAPSPHVMYTKSPSTAPAQLPATQMLVISDFSPSQDHQIGGGTKVLVCLANEIAEPFRQHTINVSFLLLNVLVISLFYSSLPFMSTL